MRRRSRRIAGGGWSDRRAAAGARPEVFADYEQLKKFFYLFFLKTPLAKPVLAADDMAFLDRLWQDWSPGYDAGENLRDVKQCLRGPGHLAAAIGYYRADEPGLSGFGTDAHVRGAGAGAGPLRAAADALPAR